MIFTLKEHLDALKEDELKTFQWHLNHVKLAWGPIPRSQLDNATRETTVDKMVQVYGEDGAVEMMVSILKMMNRNDQATSLSHAKRSSNVGLHLLESLSSAVKETHRDAEWTISVDLSHSTFSFSGPVILDSSDHQNCGTEVERKGCLHQSINVRNDDTNQYLTNTNAPISSVHSRLLSSSSILQQGPAAAPLSGPPVVSNPGVPVQSIVGMPQGKINNPLYVTAPQLPKWETDNYPYVSMREPQVEPLPSSAMLAPFPPNNSLQSLPFTSGSPVQHKNLFKKWRLGSNRDTSQAGNAPISSVHSSLLSSSSILQQGPAAAPLRPQVLPPIQFINVLVPQVKADGSYDSFVVEPVPSSALSPTTPASLYLQSLS